jgi:hypothetical protein
MFNLFEKSTDDKIVSLVEEMLTGMKDAEKEKMLKEMEYNKALAKAQKMKGSIKKNSLKMQDFVDIVRKVRKQNGWNIA